MKDISAFIANLNPEKRAEFLQKLKSKNPGTVSGGKEENKYIPAPNDNYYCSIEKSGNFNSLVLKKKEILPPTKDQVQIKVKAASLNFRDLMMAMNMYPATPGLPSVMGSDYAGVVTAVSEEVTEFKVGDEVFCLAAGSLLNDDSLDENSHFAAYITIKSAQAAHKPSNISWEEAASLPTVFLTGYYALHHAANLKKGEKVLIHTATGGVGLAAIQVAKWLEAEIFVTAGTDEKRKYLQDIGFAEPMNSRTTAFAEEVLKRTNGAGVDVILNTLAGEAADKGMKILNNFGRFLQIDKKDIAQNKCFPLGDFNKGLTYTAIDLGLFYSRQDEIKKLLDEISTHLEKGHFKPIQYSKYKIADLGQAFTYLSRAQHIGKIVVVY